jgi:hypothetical protein
MLHFKAVVWITIALNIQRRQGALADAVPGNRCCWLLWWLFRLLLLVYKWSW